MMATQQEVLRFLMDTSGRTPKFYPAEQMQQVGVVPMEGMYGEQPEDQDTDGILQRLAALMTPIANVAGLPGSVVRDTLTLRNPLDQFMTPFSSENRTSGRQMLRDYGMVGEEDTYLNAILGALAEVGTDPLALLGTGVPQMAAKATASGVSAMAPTVSKMIPGAVKNAGASMLDKASGLASQANNYAQPMAQAASNKMSSMAGAMRTPGPMPQGTAPSMMQKAMDRVPQMSNTLQRNWMTPEQKQREMVQMLAALSAGSAANRSMMNDGQ